MCRIVLDSMLEMQKGKKILTFKLKGMVLHIIKHYTITFMWYLQNLIKYVWS